MTVLNHQWIIVQPHNTSPSNPKPGKDLMIYGAPTRTAAEAAIDVFADKYNAKHDKAVACLTTNHITRHHPTRSRVTIGRPGLCDSCHNRYLLVPRRGQAARHFRKSSGRLQQPALAPLRCGAARACSHDSDVVAIQ